MKTFIASSLLLGTTTVIASCPQFAQHYMNCESSDPTQTVSSIFIKVREPFYKFSFVSDQGTRRMNIVTDGSPRDVTVQTQDGSESTYVETASCADGVLKVLRTSEESSSTEETVFNPSASSLKVTFYADGSLVNKITCYPH